MQRLCLICSFIWIIVVLMRIIPKKHFNQSPSIFNTYIVLSGLALLFFDTIVYFSNASPTADTISPSDWLAFWGSYLGFAGSLLMAYIVYKQDRIINQLTLNEYKTSLDYEFLSAGVCKRYDSSMRHNVMELGSVDSYIKHDLCPQNYLWLLPAYEIPYIFARITNIGKIAATKFTLGSISLSPINNPKAVYSYYFENSQVGGNILNGTYSLEAGCSINCAFFLHNFIRDEGNYTCILRYSYAVDGISIPGEYTFITLIKKHDKEFEYRFLDAKTQPMCRIQSREDNT